MTTLSGKQKQPTPTRQIKTAIGQIKTAPGQEFSTTHFKTCSKCKEKLPADLDSFPPEKKAKNGLKSVCRQCTRKYQNEWMRKKRESKQAKQPEDGQAGADSTVLPAAGKPPASKPKTRKKSKAVQGPANQPAKNKLALRTNLPKPPRQDSANQPTQDPASQPAKNKLALRSNLPKPPRQDSASQPTQDSANQPSQSAPCRWMEIHLNQTNNTKRLVIDFTGHEEILKKIQALARDEIRTPENQILYQLKIASSWYTLSTSSTKKQTSCQLKKQDVQPDAFNLNTDDAAH